MTDSVTGVLKRLKNKQLVLRDPATSFRPGRFDIFVPRQLEQKFRLVEGATVTGTKKRDRNGFAINNIETVCGMKPEDFAKRASWRELVAVSPTQRFDLGCLGDKSMRIVDLIAPIGKGTRGLIVSPPKAGKTTLLEQMANAILKDEPDCRVIALLIDERPEEVTAFRRSCTGAEVIASNMDQTAAEHIELAQLMLEHIRVELECRRDIVVLLDSITRMGRAFNTGGDSRGQSRTMSGGLSAGALEIPRQFFGLARNIEHGGSVTIIGTALVDTGSKMDQLIFEEFKGTGNSEIILSRDLANMRVFPAIDIPASGTRQEELLWPEKLIPKVRSIRRALYDHKPREAVESLLKIMDKYPTNKQLLESLPAL